MREPSVLLVEDNELNRELATEVLRRAGFRIIEATTAKAGLDLVRQLHPDLVLLDIRLPDMDGLEAVRRLRGDPLTATIPVVALTAQAMQGDEKAARVAGFSGYITKPINTRTLADEVRRFLSAGQPGQPS